MIAILSTGLANSVQDLGRPGHLDQGIGHGGTMDRPALIVANRLVGNAPAAAALEIASFPFRMRLDRAARIAVSGAQLGVELAGRSCATWFSLDAKPGEELRLSPPSAGARAIVAVEGGIDVPLVLGSAATDLKSGFGGLEGRHLARGDSLLLGAAGRRTMRSPDGFGVDPRVLRADAGASTARPVQMVRVLPGAEWDEFSGSLAAFLETEWQVTQEANRQGVRLSGPKLERRGGRELFSHGIMPGTVQVPPNGQPIIQLADANTCGGYPKIATVIGPDLWRLGQAPPGSRLVFRPVDRAEAMAAIRAERAALDALSGLIDSMWTPV